MSLPDEIWQYIFMYFKLDELKSCMLVCKEWKRLINHDNMWKAYIKRNNIAHRPNSNPKTVIQRSFELYMPTNYDVRYHYPDSNIYEYERVIFNVDMPIESLEDYLRLKYSHFLNGIKLVSVTTRELAWAGPMSVGLKPRIKYGIVSNSFTPVANDRIGTSSTFEIDVISKPRALKILGFTSSEGCDRTMYWAS